MSVIIRDRPDVGEQRKLPVLNLFKIPVQFHDAGRVFLQRTALCNINMTVVRIVTDAVSVVDFEISCACDSFPCFEIIFGYHSFVVGQITFIVGAVVDTGRGHCVHAPVFLKNNRALRTAERILFVLRLPCIQRDHLAGNGVSVRERGNRFRYAVLVSLLVLPAGKIIAETQEHVLSGIDAVIVERVGVGHLSVIRAVFIEVHNVHLRLPQSVKRHPGSDAD